MQSAVSAKKAHDVWALGITLVFMLVGQPPWEAATPGDARYQAFRQRDFSAMPWRAFTPELLSVCQYDCGVF